MPRPFPLRAAIALAAALALVAPSSVLAAPPAAGAVEGRVLNAATGTYLERVRLTVEGKIGRAHV